MARKKAKKRFRLVRFLTKFVVAVLVLIGIALVGLMLLPAEKIAGLAAARFEAVTGRAMVIEGAVRPSLYPQLGVKTGRVSIANAGWSEGGPLLQAESLAVGVDLAALIGGDIRITGVEAVGPEVLLEIGADGRGNWEFGAAKAGGGGSGGSGEKAGGGGSGGGGGKAGNAGGIREFSFDRAEISGGRVSFVDHRSGARYVVSDLDGTVTLPDFAGAAQVAATGRVNGQELAVDATIAEFGAFLREGAVPVALAAGIGGSALDFDGRAGLVPLAATGAVDAKLNDMAGLFAALGQPKPQLPAGLGRDTAILSGELTYAEDRLSLRGATIALDQNRLVGALDLGLAGKPKLVAKLQTGALDLSALGGDKPARRATSGGKKGGEVIRKTGRGKRSGGGWSKEPIDPAALGLMDAEVQIEAESIALGPTDLGRTSLALGLEDSRAVLDIREVEAFDGAVSGRLVANGRSGLSVSADLAGRAIALKPMLSQLAGFDRLIAAGRMTIDVIGEGRSLDAILNSLNGEGTFRIGAGELLGLDLVGMLRNLDASYVGEGAKTIFEEITGSFKIRDGVLINDNLSLLSPLLAAKGKGEVGLGGQTLDYLITPRLLSGKGKGLSVPLRIRGSWDDPKFELDLNALAGGRVDAAKDRIEEKARDAIEKKLEDELGIDLGGDKKAQNRKKGKKGKKARKKAREDARKALEEKAKEGLLDLLGGE